MTGLAVPAGFLLVGLAAIGMGQVSRLWGSGAVISLAACTLAYLILAVALRRRPVLAVFLGLGVTLGGHVAFHVARQRLVGDHQLCANCSSFIHRGLERYAKKHDGWFPRGGRDEWDSLAGAIEEEHEVHFFTSHALAASAVEHWTRTKSLSGEVSCYRYNEGLRTDDPEGLVLMYYESAGHWECSHHPMPDLGRSCLLLPGRHWEYLGEEVFQAAQRKTEEFLEGRRAR